MKLIWTETAITDRHTIYDYIELDNPLAAVELDDLFTTAAKRLTVNPKLGKPGRILGTRELVVHQSYFIVYEITNDILVILAVVHSRQQWPNND